MRTRERVKETRSYDMFADEFLTLSQAENQESIPVDFAKMRVGMRAINDAIIDLGTFTKNNPKYGDKAYVLKAIADRNYEEMRNISNYYYNSSGIYERLCKYLAYLFFI